MATVLADIFLTEDAQEILKNKFVIMIGDSVIRSMYKDLVKLLQKNDHLTDMQLKNKGEYYFENDVLLEGGRKGVMSNDVSYTEVREYKTEFHLVRFYFITRCYSDYLMSICEDIKKDNEKPDVVLMNSGCWDITRYGINSIYEYKQNLPMGILSLIRVLPSYTVFIWTTTLPLSKDVKGGFMIPEVEGRKSKLREDVLEANNYAYNVMKEFKLDVIDLHYYFLRHIQRRAKDGIHWDSTAHRRISNLILNHLCEVWNIETPGRLLIKKNPKLILQTEPFDFDLQYQQEDIYYEDNIGEYETNSNPLPDDLDEKINEIKRNSNSVVQSVNENSNDFNNENVNTNNNYNYNKNNNSKRLKTNHSNSNPNFINNNFNNNSNNNSNNNNIIKQNNNYPINYNNNQNQLLNINQYQLQNQFQLQLYQNIYQQQTLQQFQQILLTPVFRQQLAQQIASQQIAYQQNNQMQFDQNNNKKRKTRDYD